MSLISVTGGTGTLGQHVVSAALARGHEARVVSRGNGALPSSGACHAVADVLTGEGLDSALAGSDVVIHAATSPYRRAHATEVEGARHVVASTERAGAHLIYVSIVGVDHHRLPYYRAKLAAEEVVVSANTSWTIARATQFHQLLDRSLGGPFFPVTRNMRFQPVDPGEFAERLCDLAESRLTGRAPDFGGPEVLSIRDLRFIRRVVRGRAAVLLRVPAVGFLADYDRGAHLAPDHREGTLRWEDWLKKQ